MKREQSLHLCARTHTHRTSGRRWDFCSSSTWLLLMEKYPALGQPFRLYAQAQMYNLLTFQLRLCCQSIPPPKRWEHTDSGSIFFLLTPFMLHRNKILPLKKNFKKAICPEFPRAELRDLAGIRHLRSGLIACLPQVCS